MNELIEKIYGEACLTAGYLDEREFCEKVAQMVAAECARICYDEDFTSGSGYARAIRKRFGVGE
jgi:hypothetical protein